MAAITKIFDPADGFAPFVNAGVVTDVSTITRGSQIFSASLPPAWRRIGSLVRVSG